MYGYRQEKIDVDHYWDLKGYNSGILTVTWLLPQYRKQQVLKFRLGHTMHNPPKSASQTDNLGQHLRGQLHMYIQPTLISVNKNTSD